MHYNAVRDTDKFVADADEVGQPVRLSAEFSLSAAGKGCVYDISHSAKSSVPFLGGSIEKFAQKQSEEACADELDYLTAALKKTK